MDYNPSGPLSMKFPRQDHWSGLSFPSSGDLSDSGIQPTYPELAGEFFMIKPPRKPQINHLYDSILMLNSPINYMH